ncbi:MAG: sigma-54-dependent Fis family transcriptional regulator [Candidatus Latescibacteria bacterium]|nr:sigma-54-dependent Fis family transcriptional regulator [Candidatus Latescibacterota bacterium]
MTKPSSFADIVGNSPEIQEVLQKVEKISTSSTASVLIRGESGTGKELIARAIHACSSSMKGPFIELNCAAIPETMLEAELFGYEPGAFTDARSRKKGLFELAQGGTMFLDEIGVMSLNLQAKLLKVIEDKTLRRLGGVEEIRVAARIVTATNVPLEDLIVRDQFREDLYYRLNVMSVELPPLRDRGDDVLLIAKHFIARYNEEYNKTVKGLSTGAITLMKAYHWPGNIRELKNMIERAVLLGNREILEPEDFSIDRRVMTPEGEPAGQNGQVAVERRRSRRGEDEPAATGDPPQDDIVVYIPPDTGVSLEAVEKRYIEEALRMTRWNARQAARLLHLSYDTFRYRMQKHGLR